MTIYLSTEGLIKEIQKIDTLRGRVIYCSNLTDNPDFFTSVANYSGVHVRKVTNYLGYDEMLKVLGHHYKQLEFARIDPDYKHSDDLYPQMVPDNSHIIRALDPMSYRGRPNRSKSYDKPKESRSNLADGTRFLSEYGRDKLAQIKNAREAEALRYSTISYTDIYKIILAIKKYLNNDCNNTEFANAISVENLCAGLIETMSFDELKPRSKSTDYSLK